MTTTTNFAVAAPGVAAATFQEGAIVRPIRGRFSSAKEIFAKNVSFMKLLRTFVLDEYILFNYPANEVKQKTKLATYECRYRKGREHFVSEVYSSTLRVAFLFINRKSK